MKCLNCGEDLFPRQISCHRCGKIVAIAEQEHKAKTLEKAKKAKKNKEK